MAKIKNTYTCDRCGKPATINIQQTYQRYDIDDEGNTHHLNEWEGDINEFYCDGCYKGEEIN